MLSKLGCDALDRYGLNMGDVLDLLELVEKEVTQTKRGFDVTTQKMSIDHVNPIPNRNSIDPSRINVASTSSNFPNRNSIDLSEINEASTSSTFPNRNCIDTSEINEASTFSNSSVNMSFNSDTPQDIQENDSNLSKTSEAELQQTSENDLSSIIDSDDEVFVGYATRSDIKKVKNYDRKVFKNLINKYKHMKEKNVNLPKPTLASINISPDSSLEKEQRKEREPKENLKDMAPMGKKRRSEESGEKSRKKSRKTSSKKIYIPVEKAAIKEEHKAFLKCSHLTLNEKTQIKEFLQNKLNPTFSITEMLTAEAKTCKATAEVQRKLEAHGVVFENDCKKLVEALMENLYLKTENINLVSTAMREGLAASLVATYPKMAHAALLPDEKPWSWIYDKKSNKGKFANYHANKQRTSECPRLRASNSASRKSKRTAAPTVMFSHINDLQLSKDAQYLKLVMPDDRNKEEIENLMTSTFKERRTLASDPRCPVRLLIEAFPKLGDFEGRMIDFEFDLLHPDKGTLLIKNFQDLVPSLLKLANDNTAKYPPEECMTFNDMALNSLIILSKYLPKPKRVNTDTWEQKMNPLPVLEDFFHVVPVGTDLPSIVTAKRNQEQSPVQPYIIATGTPKKLERLALVLGDSKVVLLPRSTMPLKAVDLLFKTNFVLNTYFYLGWKYVMRFLASNIYKIPPENRRHSAFTEQFMHLLQQSSEQA